MASIAMLDEESIKEIAQSAYAQDADDMYELVKSKLDGFKSEVQPIVNLTGRDDGKFGSRTYLDKILQEMDKIALELNILKRTCEDMQAEALWEAARICPDKSVLVPK